MADLTVRDTKLIQYLNEAYGKEKQLETDLQAHIAMTEGRKVYKKRLQDHLKETKAQSRNLERRIKKLGGKAEIANLPGPEAATEAAVAVASVASKAKALARGPLHTLRGTSLQEKLLKNAETEFSEEHHEIAMYTAIEALAEAVGDKDTAKLARAHRREEERMAKFLVGLIPQLTKDVAKAEIPKAERNGSGTRRAPAKKRSSAARRSSSSKSASASKGASAKKSAASSKGASAKKSAASSKGASAKKSAASSKGASAKKSASSSKGASAKKSASSAKRASSSRSKSASGGRRKSGARS